METPDRPARRLVLRAVLEAVSPIVVRVISVPDSLKIHHFHDLFLAMLDWRADPDFILRVHGQAFASFRRRLRDTRLDDFRLRSQEKFLYVCEPLDLWEWEVRVLDTEPLSAVDDPAPSSRTRVLDEELESAFRDWYPGFRPEAPAPPAFRCSPLLLCSPAAFVSGAIVAVAGSRTIPA